MSKLSPIEIDALNRIGERPELQSFFFKRVKGLKWFDALEARGYFDPELNPVPVATGDGGYFHIPVWQILDYLDKTSPELRNPENREFNDRFLNIIRSVTDFAINQEVSNYKTWWYFSKICEFIPLENFDEQDIDRFNYWLSDNFDRSLVGDELGTKFLARLLNDETDHTSRLACGLLQALTLITWKANSLQEADQLEPCLPMDPYHSERVFSSVSLKIGRRLAESGVEVFKSRLNEILSKSTRDKYSYIWRPAIEDHEQNRSYHDTESILVSALRDALTGFTGAHPIDATDYVSELLKSEFFLFQRIAIYVIGKCFRELKSLTNNLLSPDYFQYNFQHEMYELLASCFERFTSEQRESVIQIVGTISEQNIDEEQPSDVQRKQVAFAAVSWLSAIKDKGFEEVDSLYAKSLNITEKEPEHPNFASYMETGWAGDPSPISSDELLSREIPEIVETLANFKQDDSWGLRKPSRRGLSIALKDAIKIQPQHFEGMLNNFLGLHQDYCYQIIEAYRDLWVEKSYDNWEEVFEFSNDLIHTEGFWQVHQGDESYSLTANNSWIVGAICDLIRKGTASDDTAFDPVLLPVVLSIIKTILANQPGEQFKIESDAVSISINSPRGKCIEALFDYSLRVCRLADLENGEHFNLWVQDLQPIYDQELGKSGEQNYEFVTLVAKYLPNILYLNQDWVLRNLTQIFDKNYQLSWLCAFQGYSYVSKVYQVIYEYLASQGDFVRALESDFVEEKVKRRIVQNIEIAYLGKFEQLENPNGLLRWMIVRWVPELIQELIWFGWTMRDKKEEVATYMIPLWSELSFKADPALPSDKRILAKLSEWSVFIDDLEGEQMELLIRSAPFANEMHHAYILIRELKRLIEDFPVQVGALMNIVTQHSAPTYKQDDIEFIIEGLYQNGGESRQLANLIVENYVSQGVEFPSRIRQKYF